MSKAKKCPESLLVTFFVLLISFSSMKETKFEKAMSSLKGALGVLMADRGSFVISQNVPLYEFQSGGEFEHKLEKVLQQLQDATEKSGTHEMVKVEKSADRIHFSISNPMLFSSGSNRLKTDSYELLKQISNVLAMLPYEVRVEGHTDNVPINTVKYPSNWELSAARALSVVRKFLEFGISPERFQVIGYGEFRPIATNATSTGRAINRRVEIYVNLKDETKKSGFINKLSPISVNN